MKSITLSITNLVDKIVINDSNKLVDEIIVSRSVIDAVRDAERSLETEHRTSITNVNPQSPSNE